MDADHLQINPDDFRFFENQNGYTELPITLNCILNLATVGLLAVISGFTTVGTPVLADQVSTTQVSDPTTVVTAKVLTVKDSVENYFSDIPIMVDIAYCESRNRQTEPDGSVFRGKANSSDIGVMQINEKYHAQEAKNLGYDIYTLDGNMAFARYLYEREGAHPWLSSSPCWAQYKNIAKS